MILYFPILIPLETFQSCRQEKKTASERNLTIPKTVFESRKPGYLEHSLQICDKTFWS